MADFTRPIIRSAEGLSRHRFLHPRTRTLGAESHRPQIAGVAWSTTLAKTTVLCTFRVATGPRAECQLTTREDLIVELALVRGGEMISSESFRNRDAAMARCI